MTAGRREPDCPDDPRAGADAAPESPHRRPHNGTTVTRGGRAHARRGRPLGRHLVRLHAPLRVAGSGGRRRGLARRAAHSHVATDAPRSTTPPAASTSLSRRIDSRADERRRRRRARRAASRDAHRPPPKPPCHRSAATRAPSGPSGLELADADAERAPRPRSRRSRRSGRALRSSAMHPF